MRYFVSLFAGSVAAVIAILIHQSLPPFGVIASLLLTYLSIWLVGRHYAGRRFKWWAALGWFLVMARASTFGSGQELLVQGDAVGTTLILLGSFTLFAAIAARI